MRRRRPDLRARSGGHVPRAGQQPRSRLRWAFPAIFAVAAAALAAGVFYNPTEVFAAAIDATLGGG